MQPEKNAQRSRADDGNDRVDLFGFDLLDQVAGTVHLLDHVLSVHLPDAERIGAGGVAQDGAAVGGEVLHNLRRKCQQTALGVAFRKEQPIKAVTDPHDLPPQLVAGQDRAGNDGVDPGDIAATDINSNAFLRCNHIGLVLCKNLSLRAGYIRRQDDLDPA